MGYCDVTESYLESKDLLVIYAMGKGFSFPIMTTANFCEECSWVLSINNLSQTSFQPQSLGKMWWGKNVPTSPIF